VRPEDAVQAARAAAGRARERGAYADADEAVRAATEPLERISTEQLVEWAVIEPDLDRVRSTRRTGAPITAAKRALVHVLRQYFAEAHAQQTRFNLHAVIRIAELEERLERAEAELARRRAGGAA
jgi:Arc/MetJ-type ribon-helix-helix transcriptional regulator